MSETVGIGSIQTDSVKKVCIGGFKTDSVRIGKFKKRLSQKKSVSAVFKTDTDYVIST